jgi:hypothetical protein
MKMVARLSLAGKCIPKPGLGTKPSLGIKGAVLTTVILRERSDRRISKYETLRFAQGDK